MIFCGLEIADVIEKNIFLLKTSAESLPYLWEKLGMKEFLLKLVVSDWKHLNGGLLLLRLFAGGMMLTHGWAKLSSFTDLSVTFPDPLGVGNTFSLVLNVFAEVGCSLCLILGFVTRLAVLPLIFNMAMAFFIIHDADAFAVREMALLYLGMYVVVFWAGGGKYAVDEIIRQKLIRRVIP